MTWTSAQPLPESVSAPAASATIHLSPVAVALSAAVLAINGFISLRFKLGLHIQLVVASVRMVVQLSILGYLLVPIFTYDKWWLVLLYGTFMLIVASIEAVQRPGYTFQGMFPNTVLAMASSSGLMLTYLVLVVLAVRPVWEAQYVIPLLGMLMGNATSAISVGLSTVLDDLAANRAVIEHLLALGANRYEATDESVRRALKVSMTPLLNQMSVMGVVSIPGLMTGQILAGGDPAQAARYQMVIMFVIAASTCLASVTSIYMAVLHIVDSTHTFRLERLVRKRQGQGRDGGASALEEWLQAGRAAWLTASRKAAALGSCLAAACCCCLRPSSPSRRLRLSPSRRQSSGLTESLLQRDGETAGGGRGAGGARAAGAAAASALASSRPNQLEDVSASGAAAASSPFASAEGTERRRPWPPVPAALRWPPWNIRRPRHGSGSAAAAAHSPPLSLQHERLLSADSTSSSLLLGGGLEAAVTSPTSVRSLTLAAAAATAGGAAAPYGWEDRSWEGGERQEEGGGERQAGDLESAGRQQQHGVASGGGPGAGRSGEGLGAGTGRGWTSSSVSAVAAVGGWLGTQAVAGWGLAWDAAARWRGGGGTGPEQGSRVEAAAAAAPTPAPVPERDPRTAAE